MTYSPPQLTGHLPSSLFLLIPFNYHAPAGNYAVSRLSFLERHSINKLVPQDKFISRYCVNELCSDSFAKIFHLPISLHQSFTIFVISLKLHSCCFLHTNANPVLYNSSFNYTVQLLTLICLLCPSRHRFTGFLYPDTWSSTCIVRPLHFHLLLSLSLYQGESQQIHWLHNSVHPSFSCKVCCESYQIRSMPHHMPTLQLHT